MEATSWAVVRLGARAAVRGRSGWLAVLLLVLVVDPPARGQTGRATGEPVEGVVVRITDRELIVDLGRDHGLPEGATVEVFRRIEVRHPASGRVIVDRFPIGSVKLAETGRLLSIARRFSRKLSALPKVGDFVIWRAGEGDEPRAGTRKTTRRTGGAKRSPEDIAREASFPYFESSLGRPLGTRLAIMRRFLTEHPTSPHRSAVEREIVFLRAMVANLRAERAAARAAVDRATRKNQEVAVARQSRPQPLTARVNAPNVALTTEPVEFVASIVERDRVAHVRLLLRRGKRGGFHVVPMEPDGDFSWRAVLPADWREPSDLEWSVEVIRQDGESELVDAGHSGRQLLLREEVRDIPDKRHRSRASADVEWVSFWLDKSNDQYLRISADFRYVIGVPVLHAFRVGVGILHGESGPTPALESGAKGQSRELTFGFAELELDFHEYFGMTARFVAGNNSNGGRDATLQSVFGGGVALRFGRINGTRMLTGFVLTEAVGHEIYIRVPIEEFEQFPMEGSVLVTNLPTGHDYYGLSINFQAGWRATELFQPFVRVGWNARTINHYGLTFGGGLVFNW